MTTLQNNNEPQQNAHKRNIYKLLFWVMFIFALGELGYCLYEQNKSSMSLQQQQTQIVTNQRDSLQGMYDATLQRLDSITGKNLHYMKELNLTITPDTTKLTAEQKRFYRLIDSTRQVKDSINDVLAYMDGINLDSLSKDQVENYAVTVNVLAGIKIKMDFMIDESRLKLLSSDTTKLASVITKYDKKKEILSRLSKRLASVTKFIKTAIDVIAVGVKAGIIVDPAKAVSQ